jgi:hypothetical protein
MGEQFEKANIFIFLHVLLLKMLAFPAEKHFVAL